MRNLSKKIVCFMLCFAILGVCGGISKPVVVDAASVSIQTTSKGLNAFVRGASSSNDAMMAVYNKYPCPADFSSIIYNHYIYNLSSTDRMEAGNYILTYTKGMRYWG